MSVSNLTIPVPGPPHDPTFWLLDSRAGWHKADLDLVEITPDDGLLALEPLPQSNRSITDPNGSFGGLTTPANVAVGSDGGVFLLDRAHALLKRFDPCECRFEIVPCFGGVGGKPRQLSNPGGIGICGGNLYVCDTGNHRLSVYSLRAFALRAHWSPPKTPASPNLWTPNDVAFDGRGRVYVTDSNNRCIHRFHPSGIWEKSLPGFGLVTNIAIDCRDRVYVVADGQPNIARVLDSEGRELDPVSRIDGLARYFPLPPFLVDGDGNLHLSTLCGSNCPANGGVFDSSGNATTAGPATPQLFSPKGTYVSRPLDSKLYRCQWHRIVIRGQIPDGSKVKVETYTSEAEASVTQIQNLADEHWETRQTATEIKGLEWDCLVRNGGGRFLWLRLTLTSSGRVTPRIESIRLEFPRISLRRFLPAVFGAEPISADFTDRFLSVFDTIERSIEKQVDQQARLFDPLSAPAGDGSNSRIDFLTWLATWIGITLDRQLPEAKRRRILKEAAKLFELRGTREGLRRQLLLFLDLSQERLCCADDQPQSRCTPAPRNCLPVETKPCAWQPPPLILEHFQLRRWLFVGAGRLGDQAVLWGKRIVNRSQLDEGAQIARTTLLTIQDPYRDPFHFYAHKFTVFVPAAFEKSERHRKSLENLLHAQRPAHTLPYIEYVAPRFRIGVQSMIGFDSVVGRYPEGFTLDQTAILGRASVLSAAPYKQGGPSLEIGKQSRIGTTTQLN